MLGEGVADALRHVERLGHRRRREAHRAAPRKRRPRRPLVDVAPPSAAADIRRTAGPTAPAEASAAAGAAAAAGGVPPPSASCSPHRDASDERAAGEGAERAGGDADGGDGAGEGRPPPLPPAKALAQAGAGAGAPSAALLRPLQLLARRKRRLRGVHREQRLRRRRRPLLLVRAASRAWRTRLARVHRQPRLRRERRQFLLRAPQLRRLRANAAFGSSATPTSTRGALPLLARDANCTGGVGGSGGRRRCCRRRRTLPAVVSGRRGRWCAAAAAAAGRRRRGVGHSFGGALFAPPWVRAAVLGERLSSEARRPSDVRLPSPILRRLRLRRRLLRRAARAAAARGCFERAFAAMEKPRSLERVAADRHRRRPRPRRAGAFLAAREGAGPPRRQAVEHPTAPTRRSSRGGSASASSPRARRCTA